MSSTKRVGYNQINPERKGWCEEPGEVFFFVFFFLSVSLLVVEMYGISYRDERGSRSSPEKPECKC